ncbi:MAG TPA: TIR domain-containing protein, partial [Pyrinomonadaceae bacterium]|nr:TIR domain-containing protein [Pyrinomonadaceae bacterium]
MSRSIAPHADRSAPARAVFEPTSATAAPAAEKSVPLRLLLSPETSPRLTLPTLATAGDVREAVQYLKKKPSGVSVAEAMDDVKRRVFEPRKVAAYEFWGVVTRRHDRLHLSPLGWEFARKLEPETEAYRALLDQTEPYRAALEWMHGDALELVTHGDVADFWLRHYGDALDHEDRSMEANVVCFFHLCQAAELGTVTIGKRGQPARLRVEREELALHVDAHSRAATVKADDAEAEPRDTHVERRVLPAEPRDAPAERHVSSNERRESFPVVPPPRAGAQGLSPRVFVSAGRESKLLGRVRTALELADIECRVSVREQNGAAAREGAGLVSDEMFRAMHQCEAAVVVISRDDFETNAEGEPSLSQSLLVEIGAAFVLYERRVALLWSCGLEVPANLRELPRVSFEGDELT